MNMAEKTITMKHPVHNQALYRHPSAAERSMVCLDALINCTAKHKKFMFQEMQAPKYVL